MQDGSPLDRPDFGPLASCIDRASYGATSKVADEHEIVAGAFDKRPDGMQNSTLPETFRPLLWSYDFSRIDPLKHKKTISVQALNYGTLAHWRWLVQSYGREGVRDVLTHVPASEIKSRSLRLASLVFGVQRFNYAKRGTH
jgi:hypothetical protein